MSPHELDPTSRKLQATIEDLIGNLSHGNEVERCRRWKQIYSWAYNRTQGDPEKKKRLKVRLVQQRGSNCEKCGHSMLAPELQMHRLNSAYACDRAHNMGYFEDNVRLLCVVCHRKAEGLDHDFESLDAVPAPDAIHPRA